jgi:hypothetical protein
MDLSEQWQLIEAKIQPNSAPESATSSYQSWIVGAAFAGCS